MPKRSCSIAIPALILFFVFTITKIDEFQLTIFEIKLDYI